MLVPSHYFHVPCSRRTPSSSTEEKMWHLGCGCKARFRSAHVHPRSSKSAEIFKLFQIQWWILLESLGVQLSTGARRRFQGKRFGHGGHRVSSAGSLIAPCHHQGWALVTVISQGHGGKCGFVHGTHRFLEFEPLRATWQFGSVRTSWNHLGVLLAAILPHVSIVSDVFSMLSFHPATPRLDKARCLVCTQKFTSSTHVWHLPRAQEPRRSGLPERFMWLWRDRVQSQMGSVFWLGSDGVEEHPFPQNIQIFLGLAASRLHLHRLRPCISAAVTTMASSLIQTLAVICHNHALWCGLQVTIRGKSRVIVSGHWSIYLCNFWSLYFWFTRNLCLWRHFKHILQVRCHFQSLFRNFEIVLQGGHGELSQWCWRWHEAQGGVTQRMFRFFFSNFHGPRLREIGTVPQLVPCNSAKCQKQSLFRHLHIPSVVPVTMFGTRQHKTSLRVCWLCGFLILLVCLFGCFSAGSGHHPWCLQNAPALCGRCLSQPRREAGVWEY